MSTLHAWIERCGSAHYSVSILNCIRYQHIAGMNWPLRKCTLCRFCSKLHMIWTCCKHELSTSELIIISILFGNHIGYKKFAVMSRTPQNSIQDHWTFPNGTRVSSDGARVRSLAIWGPLGAMSLKARPEMGHFRCSQYRCESVDHTVAFVF